MMMIYGFVLVEYNRVIYILLENRLMSLKAWISHYHKKSCVYGGCGSETEPALGLQEKPAGEGYFCRLDAAFIGRSL
jgi:hypothetical protein